MDSEDHHGRDALLFSSDIQFAKVEVAGSNPVSPLGLRIVLPHLVDRRRLQHFNGFQPTFHRSSGVDVQIRIDTMTLL